MPSSVSLDADEGEGSSRSQQVQKSTSGLRAGPSCVSDCTHKVPLGSEVLIEIKVIIANWVSKVVQTSQNRLIEDRWIADCDFYKT